MTAMPACYLCEVDRHHKKAIMNTYTQQSIMCIIYSLITDV